MGSYIKIGVLSIYLIIYCGIIYVTPKLSDLENQIATNAQGLR